MGRTFTLAPVGRTPVEIGHPCLVNQGFQMRMPREKRRPVPAPIEGCDDASRAEQFLIPFEHRRRVLEEEQHVREPQHVEGPPLGAGSLREVVPLYRYCSFEVVSPDLFSGDLEMRLGVVDSDHGGVLAEHVGEQREDTTRTAPEIEDSKGLLGRQSLRDSFESLPERGCTNWSYASIPSA